jgi:hypothetical protein
MNWPLRLDPGYAYQDDGTAYAPHCSLAGPPANARIIDDVPDGTPSIRPDGDGTQDIAFDAVAFVPAPDGRVLNVLHWNLAGAAQRDQPAHRAPESSSDKPVTACHTRRVRAFRLITETVRAQEGRRCRIGSKS